MSRYALALCIAYIGVTLMVAQDTAPEVEITNEPHHHLTFENQYVRVFNVQVDPHSETLMHWHRHDYIYVTLGAAEVVNAVKEKPPITVKLQEGETRFSPASFAHIARNLTDQPFRNVTIEILQDESLRNAAASGTIHWDEERGLELLTGGTKQILFVKDGIRVAEFELQPGGIVPVHHRAGPQLLVAVTDLDLREDDLRSDVERSGKNSNAKSAVMTDPALHMKSGDHKWLPANYSHTITSTGSKPAKFVTLEFP